ncbi:hypothetical protein D3C81_1502090 [compost metagenome]
MIDTNADAPSARGSGMRSNFSISGKLMSTCGLFCSRRARISSGRRCRVCGPNTRSTYGARLMMASPSCEATQPPTPMMTSRPPALSAFQRPSWLNTFSCAFSRMEQVLTSTTSASSGLSVNSSPSASASTSAILVESYSFIWQPWVLMYSLPRAPPATFGLTPGRGINSGVVISTDGAAEPALIGRGEAGVPGMVLIPDGWAGRRPEAANEAGYCIDRGRSTAKRLRQILGKLR